MKLLWDVGLLVLIGAAGVVHFGWLAGLAITAAVYHLMPYQAVRAR